ncbi:ABC transporter permease [Arthrobacter roseus]|uniref:ABC transporter permease n=1 Tax=Arthrobacter roseus TaxID=136274 RepID=UPI001965D94E|nr:proline/glycine betaine ABC transporter permease [Arthrobacter roseus]MBM7847790.1 ABC-type proline/glycine betaine transport system permease subunit [Arthrobacter roseus]
MNEFRIPLGDWVEAGIDWIKDNLAGLFDIVSLIFKYSYDGLEWILLTPPFYVIMLALIAIGWAVKNWKFAIGTAVGVALILGMNQWENSMQSLALVLFASFIAVVLSVPLGILAAKSNRASAILKPILDFLQTMPAFVYLIPAIALFSVGVVPGIFATILFAMAPGARFTELGIRGVDTEVVEAGHAFGSSPWRVLRQIQIPLAMPTIMAGINQVIMLSLSMVVIAGMVGAGGLGGDVVGALQGLDTGLGFEAGISVVILAIYLDRLSASIGKSRVSTATA